MLGGIDTSLFVTGFGGFLILGLFAFLLRWTFSSRPQQISKERRREIKASLRELKRK